MSNASVKSLKASQLVEEAALHATLIKAALVRSVFSRDIVMGRDDDDMPYTPDFSDPRNLAFVDRNYIRKAQEILKEADSRGMTTAMTQMFTPQGMLAVELGTVTAFTFDELTDHVYMRQNDGRAAAGKSVQSDVGAVVVAFPSQWHG